jgi:hypothetical protein
VNRIRIYIDEDSMDHDLVAALRSRDVGVLTPLEENRTGRRDPEQLEFASERGCVLYSCNVGDFYRLHTLCLKAGRTHAGMILAPQQRFSIGELLRLILRLRGTLSAEDMRNRVEFLANWAPRA